MVASRLTEELIAGGKALISTLDKGNAKVPAAFWLLPPEQNFWKLMILFEDVEKEGPKAAYSRVQKALSKLPQGGELSLDDVVLLKPSAPVVKLLRAAIRTGPEISGIRFTNNVINGHLIPDAYVYRLQ